MKGTPDPAKINAELLAKGADTVPLLLSYLESGERGDFYVRYHTIQLLTALAAGGPYRLQGVRAPSCTAAWNSAGQFLGD